MADTPGSFDTTITAQVPWTVVSGSSNGGLDTIIVAQIPWEIVVGHVAVQYTATPSGSLTPTGAIVKASTKTYAGSLTPTGSPAKRTAKTFAGGLTPSGVLATAKTALVSAAGSVTPTGALIRQTTKALAGSITPAGALVRKAIKAFTGTLTPAGAIVRSIGKILAGALTPSGGASGSKSASAPTIVTGYTEAGNAANSLTLVINTPTHSNGDKIYIVYVTDADSPTTASPSGTGWTTLEGPQDVSSSSVSTAGVMYVWYKTASSEGASYTITASTSERAVAIAFAVTGDNGIDAEATYATGTDTSAEVGAVTTTVAHTLRISVVVSQGVRTVSTLTGHTLLATHSYTSAGTISVQYKQVATAGADAGQTATLDTGGWGSHAWAIKPAVAGTNYTSSIAGALAPVGALTRQTGKAVAGSLTPVGTIFKRIGKVLAGALGLSGVLTRLKSSFFIADVTVTDTTVTECSLSIAAVTVCTPADSAVTTVVLTDATHE